MFSCSGVAPLSLDDRLFLILFVRIDTRYPPLVSRTDTARSGIQLGTRVHKATTSDRVLRSLVLSLRRTSGSRL